MDQDEALITAGILALGWMVGKGGQNETPTVVLAAALKQNGVKSHYVEEILRLAFERAKHKEPADGIL